MSTLIDELNRSVHSGRLVTYMVDWQEPRLFPPASAEQLAASEAKLGFEIPALLREVLVSVGNGGFGPGYGLLGIEGGADDGSMQGSNAVDLYTSFRAKPKTPAWPRKVIPICHWGCEIYSCLDCSSDDGPVIAFDPGRKGSGPWRRDYKIHVDTFSGWLTKWLRDEELFDSMPLDGEPYIAFRDG